VIILSAALLLAVALYNVLSGGEVKQTIQTKLQQILAGEGGGISAGPSLGPTGGSPAKPNKPAPKPPAKKPPKPQPSGGGENALGRAISNPYVQAGVDFVLDNAPVVGNFKSLYEAASGKDIYGHKLSKTDRALALLGVIVPQAKNAKRVLKLGEEGVDVGKNLLKRGGKLRKACGQNAGTQCGPSSPKSNKKPQEPEIPKKYQTAIDDKVTVIEKQELPKQVADSFLDGYYRTVVTNEEITLYRVYGGNADKFGSYAATTPAGNRIQVKMDSALLPQWKNTREYEVVIKVPKGAVLNIGKVAPQTTKSGAVLPGGGDQIVLPHPPPKEWFTVERKVPSR